MKARLPSQLASGGQGARRRAPGPLAREVLPFPVFSARPLCGPYLFPHLIPVLLYETLCSILY
jgi:hypothetical protein